MEKRKSIGLQGYFIRSMLLAIFGAILILLGAVLVFDRLLAYGIAYPANAGERFASQAMQSLQSGQMFQASGDALYEYVEFAAEGQVLRASQEGQALDMLLEKYNNREATYQTARYITAQDGNQWLFTWEYQSKFANPYLRAHLPSFEFVILGMTIAVLFLFFLIYVHRLSRSLSMRLKTMEVASQQIAAQDLNAAINASSGIREFDAVLEGMEKMRRALNDSLSEQWKAEQQRREEMASLAHDMKTPLTIIRGNAELLFEDEMLSEMQSALVLPLLRASERAQQYIALLQQAATSVPKENLQPRSVEAILGDLEASIGTIALQKRVVLDVQIPKQEHVVPISRTTLLRALVNVAENAIRYTPAGKSVQVKVKHNDAFLEFVITDGGEGFSAGALMHATEMLWQDDKVRGIGGSYGMGLAIATKVAIAHGGALTLANVKAGGQVTLRIASK